MLEKHKDYSLRAKDFNTKKKKLSILQQKSKERHPDEFSFGMLSQQGQGKHGQRGTENRLSHDAVQLLKTQDVGYLRNAMQRTRREVERAEEEVGMDKALRRRDDGSAKKTTFDADGEPLRKKARMSTGSMVGDDRRDEDLNVPRATTSTVTNTSGHPAEAPSSNPASKVLSRKQQLKEKDRLAQLKADRKRRKRLSELRTTKLELLRKRQKDILAAVNELELQRAKMGNVVGGTNKHGVKFKVRERKR